MPTSKAISASKFFGKDRYEYYLNELLNEKTLGGHQLSKEELKEAFSKRKNKISFEKFVDQVVKTKTVKTASAKVGVPGTGPILSPGGLGPMSPGGSIVKSPPGLIQKYGEISKTKPFTIEDDISKITAAVISISETLKKQKKLSEDSEAYNKRKTEQEKRALAESKLEKRFEGLKKAAEKIIAPVKSVLDRILQFFTTVILGRIVYKLVEWLGNPENAGKVKSIIRFVKDWWPALLGSYILFGTSFGKLVRGLTGLVGKFIFRIAKVAIPKLLGFIKKNSKLGVATALFTAGATIPALFPQTVDEQERKVKEKPGSSEDKIRALEQQKANLNIIQRMQGVGSEIDEQISALKTGTTKSYGFSGGGSVNGFVSGEKGVDKVPAMLSDGEFVMSRGAVAKYGVDTLEAMNASGGGTNKPKIVYGTTYAAGGGLVGRSGSYDVDKFAGSAGYYVNEILKGLAPQYKWASKLASEAGISAQNAISKSASGAYDGFMNQGAKLHGYLTRGGMQNDIMNMGNQTFDYLKSSDFQNELKQKGTKLINAGQSLTSGALSAVDKLQLGKKYQDMADRNQKRTDKQINSYDSWIKDLPEGFIKDTMNRGLIPIPTFGEKTMTAFTFAKAMAGPFGRPFRIMSNEVVDRARQEMIDKTAKGGGLRVDPKTGKLSMDWNRVGSGQYTDEFDTLGGDKGRGKFLNSTFGRFSAQQKGDRLVTGDVYNFNETVKQYAVKSRDSLMKGNVGDALYNVLAMSGRLAQDIGWLNQRALGSEVDIGSVKNIDSKTGKPKPVPTPASVTMYEKDDPRKKDSGPYKSRFARPKNAGIKPPAPPSKPNPKVTVIQSPSKNRNRGGQRSAASSQTPNFSASSQNKNSKAKMSLLGIVI